jgi:hypothetical protein
MLVDIVIAAMARLPALAPTQLRPPASISVFSLRLTQPHTWASAAIFIDKYQARGF